ncbi:trans-Golgi network integral membrane protein TGN38-like isoform X2 [Leptopilina heterotoma]|uniref:trans-Golgi network integral membrane protein TGN38-like isoform X2 n=1 Tax=Leptopilina heterotoma TaxID=63436 RepID=UPI001CA9140D|nr:trans-Golgi network integral membrane protein TGN38-like isoform X2 [Leptopilina heterotoma]
MKNLQYFLFSLIYIFSDNACNALPRNFTETSKGFVVPCPTVNFFRDSNYTKSCFHDDKFNTSHLMCSALYDLGFKWCTMSSLNVNLPKFVDATQFDKVVSNFDNVNDVMKFCTVKKNVTNKNDTKLLESFYKNLAVCAIKCLNSERNNEEPIKLCSALTFLESKMISSNVTITKQQTVNEEPKQDESSKPAANPLNNSDKNSEKISNVNNENLPSDTNLKESPLKSVNSHPVIEEQLSKKNEQVPVQKEPSNLEIEGKNEQDKKNDKIPNLGDNADSRTDQKVQENPVIESTGNRANPEVHKSEADGTKSDRIESGSGKTAKKVSNNEEIKSSTISEHTNDGAAFSEDGEIPILNIPNQEPDLISENKIIPHYPGKKAEEESHIFSYFVAFSLLFVCCYIGYLNKKKILAILLEGRRSRNGRGRRRPSTANYRKLDSNLEEAVTSQCNTNATNVIY